MGSEVEVERKVYKNEKRFGVEETEKDLQNLIL